MASPTLADRPMSPAFYEARRKDGERRRGSGPWWTGDAATYTARHKRVRRARGRAGDQLCVWHLEEDQEKAANDWAQVHGTDGLDVWADYVALCRSCHIRYDGIIELRAQRHPELWPGKGKGEPHPR